MVVLINPLLNLPDSDNLGKLWQLVTCLPDVLHSCTWSQPHSCLKTINDRINRVGNTKTMKKMPWSTDMHPVTLSMFVLGMGCWLELKIPLSLSLIFSLHLCQCISANSHASSMSLKHVGPKLLSRAHSC